MSLSHVLGGVPVIRMLDFFVGSPHMDHTRGEIEEQAGVRHVDMSRDFPCLVDAGVVVETRRIRGEPLFRLDIDNPVTRAVLVFNAALAGDRLVMDDVVVVPTSPVLVTQEVDEGTDAKIKDSSDDPGRDG